MKTQLELATIDRIGTLVLGAIAIFGGALLIWLAPEYLPFALLFFSAVLFAWSIR